MVHDYWLYRPDPEPARASLPGTRAVLNWFARYEQPDGLLKELPEWSFVDWVSAGTIPTYSANGESCATTLEYVGALGEAADLEKALGDPELAASYQARATHVRKGLFDKCWSAPRGLIADNPDLKNFNQQANILAVLYDVVPKDHRQEVLRKMLVIEPGTVPDGVLSASYYFRFYLARAMQHAGIADEYLHSLDPWRNCYLCTSAHGLKSPAIRVLTPTPGHPIPSTICSPWLPASNRPALALPRSASPRTWAHCPR